MIMKKISFSLLMVVAFFVTTFAQNDAKTKTSSVNTPAIISSPSDLIYLLDEKLDIVVASDTTALQSRGFKMYYQSIPLGDSRWFPGNVSQFGPKEGTGYLAANYANTSGSGTIDTWLVSPKLPILIGDSVSFWQRSPDGSTFYDYLMIMFNAAGDSVPSAPTWTTLVTSFQTSTSGWVRSKFAFTADGTPNARFAIRYYVPNGGPSGSASDYVGIDLLQVVRNSVGLNEIKNNATVNIFPCPANDFLNVTIGNISQSTIQVKIFNTIGTLLYNRSYEVQNDIPTSIDLCKFEPGSYMLQILINNQLVTKKFTVIK